VDLKADANVSEERSASMFRDGARNACVYLEIRAALQPRKPTSIFALSFLWFSLVSPAVTKGHVTGHSCCVIKQDKLNKV
jgi:hypothetical protein